VKFNNSFQLRVEKDRQSLKVEINDLISRNESFLKGKIAAEKNSKTLEQQVQNALLKIETYVQEINDLSQFKSRSHFEMTNLSKKLDEAEAQISQLEKTKRQLISQVDEAKHKTRDESRNRGSLLQYNHLNVEITELKAQLEHTKQSNVELQKMISKTNQQGLQWKSMYENDALNKIYELEDTRKKLLVKLQETEEKFAQENANKLNNEKGLLRLQAELNESQAEIQRINGMLFTTDKKAKQSEKLANELKLKCDSMTIDLETAQNESKQHSIELFKTKQHCSQINEQNEKLNKEIKTLTDQLNELDAKLKEDDKRALNSGKAKNRCEIEKEALREALEAAENSVNAEKNKLAKLSIEFNQYKQNIERLLSEKEDEIQNMRYFNST
jgi:chromosome segregation ATPase